MARFAKMKQDCGLTIDHLDGDYHNNTQANLSLMPGMLNSRKSAKTKKFLFPYKLTCAYVGDSYRLLLTAGDNVLEAKVLEDAESFVGALCGLLGTCYPNTGLPTPQDYYSRYKGD